MCEICKKVENGKPSGFDVVFLVGDKRVNQTELDTAMKIFVSKMGMKKVQEALNNARVYERRK